MDEEIKKTFREYGRGIMGGLIFSLPLLYTMEMWWRGFTASPIYLMCFVVATYLLLLGYNSYAGMRRDTSIKGVMWDSVEELGLGVILSFIFLFMIGKISLLMPVNELLGKVIVESMMVAIGISVGTAQLGKENEGESGPKNSDKEQNELVKAVVLSLCGAVLVSSSVAPTSEILKIAVEVTAVHLISMVIASLIAITIVFFFINFRGTSEEKKGKQEMAFHVLLAYVVALIVSFGFLYFFGRVRSYGFHIVLAQVIVLGLPTAIGASAGKLLIGKN